jgi:small-conductance mechanosensitive channel
MALHKKHVDRFKQKAEEHYEQLKRFRSQWANKRIIFFTFLLLVFLAVLSVHKYELLLLPETMVRSSTLILTILITFTVSSVIVWLLEGRIFKLLKDEVEIEKSLFYTKIFTFLVYLSAIIISLYAIGISPGNLTLVAGLLTTAFAISMREVIVSYFVWMILLFKRPFRIGEFIKIGDDEGRVAHIGTFYVAIDDGTDARIRMLKVPTRTFLDKTIIGYGEGEVPQDLRLKVQSLPKDVDKRLQELLAVVKSITGYANSSVTLDIDGEQPVLVIHYEVEFVGRKQVKTQVIAQVYEITADLRKKE